MENEERIQTIPLAALHPHPRNAEFFDDADAEAFENLKESIANVGLLTPLRISKNYTIISGHQRYRACKELGIDYIPCIVDDGLTDENEMVMQLIVSNFGRMKNDPAKQGKMIEEYEKMMGVKQGGDRKSSETKFRLNQGDVAKQFGITPQSMREYKRFAHMPPEVQESVKSGKFSMTAAVRVLNTLPAEEQLKVISSFPETLERITQAALQQKVEELYAKEEEELATYKASYDKATENKKKQLQNKERELTQMSTNAQEQLNRINFQINMMQSKLSKTQQELDSKLNELEKVNRLIGEASAQITPPAPQMTIPKDYEEIKRKAAEYDKMKQQLENMRNSTPKIVTEHEASVKRTDLEESQACWEKLQDMFTELEFHLDNYIGDASIMGRLSLIQRQGVTKRATIIATKLNQFANNMEVN